MVELAKIITIGDMSGSSFMFSEREMLAFSVTLKVLSDARNCYIGSVCNTVISSKVKRGVPLTSSVSNL